MTSRTSESIIILTGKSDPGIDWFSVEQFYQELHKFPSSIICWVNCLESFNYNKYYSTN